MQTGLKLGALTFEFQWDKIQMGGKQMSQENIDVVVVGCNPLNNPNQNNRPKYLLSMIDNDQVL